MSTVLCRKPVITFHDITHAHAIAAAVQETGILVDAVTAPGAVRSLGAVILKTIADEAGLDQVLIDCLSSAESAQLALRAGWTKILLEETSPAFGRFVGQAETGGQILPRKTWLAAAPARLDLRRLDCSGQSCKDFLKNFQR